MVSAVSQPAAEPPRWELYRLLADPSRLRLLALTAAEELAVSELADLLSESQPTVSRQASALRDAGLVRGRKQGTWLLLRLAPEADADPVVADALEAGVALCEADGSLARVAEVVASRDGATREYFARGGGKARSGPPDELAAYLRALAPLLPRRKLAIDAGTGDGGLLEVLAPLFDRVIAIDRSEAQIDLAAERIAARGFDNVRFACGELDGPEVAGALRATRQPGADAVFAARVLHHAAVPKRAFASLVALARPPEETARSGGAVVVIDYESHRDEALRERQADLWLGFEPKELEAMAKTAGLEGVRHGRLPKRWNGDGPDRHLDWHWLSGRRAR